MQMGNGWQVRFETDEALVFALAPDGTVKMRVIPRTEWEATISSGGSERPIRDQIMRLVDEESSAPRALSGSSASRGVTHTG